LTAASLVPFPAGDETVGPELVELLVEVPVGVELWVQPAASNATLASTPIPAIERIFMMAPSPRLRFDSAWASCVRND